MAAGEEEQVLSNVEQVIGGGGTGLDGEGKCSIISLFEPLRSSIFLPVKPWTKLLLCRSFGLQWRIFPRSHLTSFQPPRRNAQHNC